MTQTTITPLVRLAVAAALAVASFAATAGNDSADTPADDANVAAADTDSGSSTMQEVVVSARIRQENIEDVPIPVSAIDSELLNNFNAVTMTDFGKFAPNLIVNAPNARQTSIAIRGIGKNTANDALEPSVGVIVDGVASAYIAQSWGDFPDLDHVEVERGPQGTLLGKNTTLGVVQIVSKAPSFQNGYTAEAGAGTGNDINGKFSATGPVIDGLLAYRASFYGDKGNGPYRDASPDDTSQYFGEKNRFGGKLQLLLTPSDTLSIRLIADLETSAELITWGEPPLIGDPLDFPNGISRTIGTGTTWSSRLARGYFDGNAPLIGNWDQLQNTGAQPTRTNTSGVSAEINWKLGGYTVTSISAERNALFDAKNGNWTDFNIARSGAIIRQTQLSEELRLNSPVGEFIDYTTGVYLLDSHINSCDRNLYSTDSGAFYASNAQYAALSTGPGRALLQDSLNNLFVYTCTQPRTTSEAGFGQANLHLTSQATLTLGARVTHEDKNNGYQKYVVTPSAFNADIASGDFPGATAAQLTAAQGILSAQQLALGSVVGQSISATSYAWLINPNYKLTDDLLLYLSASHGEKSGAVLFNTSTLTPLNVRPERTLDFELGVKAQLLNKTLTINANLYDTEVSDYQQNVTVTDPTTTTGFRTYLGNAPKVRLRGVELDSHYDPNRIVSISFGGAYNHATYADFDDAPCPADIAGQTNAKGVVVGSYQCNLTGQQIPYAPRFTANLGVDLNIPIVRGYFVHGYANELFHSRANYAAGLSQYGEWGSYSVIDSGVGIQTPDHKWEFDAIARNLFDKQYVQDITTYTNQAAITAFPGERRYVGIQVRLHE